MQFAGASTGARLKRKRACTSAPFVDNSLLLTDRATAQRACTDAVRSSVADGAGCAADASTDALAAADADTADMRAVRRRAECEAADVLKGSPAAEGVAAPCSGAPAAATQVHTQLSERRGSSPTLTAGPGAFASPSLGARQPGDPCGSGAGAAGAECLSRVPGAATVAERPALDHGVAAQPEAEHEAAAGAPGAAGVSLAPGPAASLPATAFYRRWRMSQVSSSPSRPVSFIIFLVIHRLALHHVVQELQDWDD